MQYYHTVIGCEQNLCVGGRRNVSTCCSVTVLWATIRHYTKWQNTTLLSSIAIRKFYFCRNVNVGGKENHLYIAAVSDVLPIVCLLTRDLWHPAHAGNTELITNTGSTTRPTLAPFPQQTLISLVVSETNEDTEGAGKPFEHYSKQTKLGRRDKIQLFW